MNVSELAQRMGGELRGEDADFVEFFLDSRDEVHGRVYLAIQGERVDGHEFVPDVLARGAVAAVVARPIPGRTIQVENVAEAVARYGRSIRGQFSGPVVGITGSNGKTSAKEMIAAILSTRAPVLKSEGNQNTEWTSPLSWHRLKPEHWAAVIEMGMRGPGQVAHLASISEPTHGLITMIGTAHIELLGSRERIAEVKSELLLDLPSSGAAFLWREDDFFKYLAGRSAAPVRTFGESEGADARVLEYSISPAGQAEFKIAVDGDVVEGALPMIGRHQALNVAAALLIASTLGIEPSRAIEGLANVAAPPMRMQVVHWHGATVLLDAYNASPDSMRAALNVLRDMPCSGRRIAVLGTMRELGEWSESSHKEIGVQAQWVDELLTLGEETEDMIRAAGKGRRAFSIDELRSWLADIGPGDLVLIKGSRALALEKLLEEPK